MKSFTAVLLATAAMAIKLDSYEDAPMPTGPPPAAMGKFCFKTPSAAEAAKMFNHIVKPGSTKMNGGELIHSSYKIFAEFD